MFKAVRKMSGKFIICIRDYFGRAELYTVTSSIKECSNGIEFVCNDITGIDVHEYITHSSVDIADIYDLKGKTMFIPFSNIQSIIDLDNSSDTMDCF